MERWGAVGVDRRQRISIVFRVPGSLHLAYHLFSARIRAIRSALAFFHCFHEFFELQKLVASIEIVECKSREGNVAHA